VFLAEHQTMGRRVALKVLPLQSAQDPTVVERFRREARAVARLDHPNIVRAYDVGTVGKLYFLVMEYVDGTNLQGLVERQGRLSPTQAAQYTRQAARALAHLHQSGLVHRDVKPSNLLLDRSGVVKLTDLGLARFCHDAVDKLTQQQGAGVMGTLDYLSPEQAEDSHGVDIRTDIYSLGATLYFLLVGRPPFQGGSASRKLVQIQMSEPEDVRELRPEVPEGLAVILRHMMAKNPERRYQTPQEVVDALADHETEESSTVNQRHDRSVTATRRPVEPEEVEEVEEELEDEVPPSARVRKERSPARDERSEAQPRDQITKTRRSKTREPAERPRRQRKGVSRSRPAIPRLWLVLAPALGVLFVGVLGVLFLWLLWGRRPEPSPQQTVQEQPQGPKQPEGPKQPDGPIHVFVGHSSRVEAVAWSPDGSVLLSGSDNGDLFLWDMQTYRRLHTFPRSVEGLWSVAISPDGQRLAVGGTRQGIAIWDLKTRVLKRVLKEEPRGVPGVTFTPDSRSVVTSCSGGAVRLWDAETGNRLLTYSEPVLGKGWYWAAVSWNGKYVAVGGEGPELRLFDTQKGDLIRSFVGHTGAVRRLAFSADGRQLVSCGFDSQVILWETETGKEVRRFLGHTGYVEWVGFSPDGQTLLTTEGPGGGGGGNPSDLGLRLWDVRSGQQLQRFGGIPEKVLCAAFSPDGRQVAVGCGDRVVRLYDIARWTGPRR
jgi:serine/threonine protein kinase